MLYDSGLVFETDTVTAGCTPEVLVSETATSAGKVESVFFVMVIQNSNLLTIRKLFSMEKTLFKNVLSAVAFVVAADSDFLAVFLVVHVGVGSGGFTTIVSFVVEFTGGTQPSSPGV